LGLGVKCVFDKQVKFILEAIFHELKMGRALMWRACKLFAVTPCEEARRQSGGWEGG
jgi:hypothetical protein